MAGKVSRCSELGDRVTHTSEGLCGSEVARYIVCSGYVGIVCASNTEAACQVHYGRGLRISKN